MSLNQALGLCTIAVLMLVIGGTGCVIIKPVETFIVLEKMKKSLKDMESDAWVQKSTDELNRERMK